MKRRFVKLTSKAQGGIFEEDFDYENMDLKDNEAIIEAEATLISAGTELSRVYEIKKGFSYPVYPGYTAVGKVLKKGNGLKDIEVGDRVFYSGPHSSIIKYAHVGTTQGSKIIKIDERLRSKEALLLQMGLISMNAITASNGKITDTCGVFGLGTVGLFAAILLEKSGMRVIGIDNVKSRTKKALDCGLKEVIDVSFDKQIEEINRLTNGKGLDVVVDATGASAAIVTAIDVAKKHGQVILLGSPRESYVCDITKTFNAIHMKMLDVKGAFNELNPFNNTDGLRRNVLKDFETVTNLILDKTFDADKIIDHIIKPEEIMKAYEGLMFDKENYSCVMIDWTK